ncbi:MAG: 5-methyltetrahydropteroyltriglutamate--homocysteine S-methyltransferase [Dehalococcoidia bacterium]|nr:5-methyltetrahydropteroyltriglutamate--homocysteine S-methyltransferase [Dehalococcoidia bacterium]
MVSSANLGFPRIGTNRELKKAVEGYWTGKNDLDALLLTAKNIRIANWELQLNAGIDHIPSNDFSMYDQMLDTAIMLGAIPQRFAKESFNSKEELYFAMARGLQTDFIDVKPLEMTKWFDTNYHYLVPEISKDTSFVLQADKILDEYNEAKAIGINTRPVIIGPMTFLMLSKFVENDTTLTTSLEQLVPIYIELLNLLAEEGCEWVQIDEPILVTDLNVDQKISFQRAYDLISKKTSIKKMLTTYFGSIHENLSLLKDLNIQGLHIDCVLGEKNLDIKLDELPKDIILSLGVINGRNIWINDLTNSISIINKFIDTIGVDRVIVSSSCSLLHSPIDLTIEDSLDEEIKDWMAFAKEKITEINLLSTYFNGRNVQDSIDENLKHISNRKTSAKVNNLSVQNRLNEVSPEMKKRNSNYSVRALKQSEILNLPLLPTTTIGSFPQTKEVRQMRAKAKKGLISHKEYDEFLLSSTRDVIEFQDSIGLDVLVHGEFERNDMVEYFGEKLEGFIFSKNGWVQSYGSRCVKPPIIFGDISREEAMTIDWIKKAQSFTDKHVKGMLTGPVTILQWSFVRDDQPLQVTCEQIALAIRDEVSDLADNDIKIIQIDEPALREGLPLRKMEQIDYLNWAVDCFKLSSSGVPDIVQIHTHMCYAEFNEIMDAIISLDADVISIEASRSSMELLAAFSANDYPNEIGPGVYDIHSPRTPSVNEMVKLINNLRTHLVADRLWINPDCGLKTRGWDEVKTSLTNMVLASLAVRKELEKS